MTTVVVPLSAFLRIIFISIELSLSQNGYGLLKIQSVQDEDQLHEVLLQDDVLQVLEEIGYKGVPQKETLVSSKNLIQ